MASPAIRIYDALKPTLGEGPTKEFIEALDESIAAKIEHMKSDLATKGDVEALRGDFAALREATRDDIAAVKEEVAASRLETKNDLAAVRSKLKEEITALRLATGDDTAAVKNELKDEIAAVRDNLTALSTDFKEFKCEMKAYMGNLRVYVRGEIFRTAAIIGLAQIMAIIAAVVAIIKAMTKL